MRKRDNESSSRDLIDLLAFESRFWLCTSDDSIRPGEVVRVRAFPPFENYVSLIDRVLIPVIIER